MDTVLHFRNKPVVTCMRTQEDKNHENYAVIFDIQRFSLHDGPGIRTTIFFKGCPLSCVWCQNPESQKAGPEMAFYAEQCQKSYACADICPQNAILKAKQRRINYDRCDACGKCALECPFNALRIIGKKWHYKELADESLKDKDYFLDSKGGITLSGGEPVLHVKFLQNFLPLLKKHGIHVNIETCGVFKFKEIERILLYLDLIYYDIKHIDPKVHKQYTGGDNILILDNFARMAKVFPKLQARIPIIPGVNNDRENILATARFLKQNNQTSIHCLPYHSLGGAKLARINSGPAPFNLQSITAEDLLPIKKMFQEEGIHAVVYD